MAQVERVKENKATKKRDDRKEAATKAAWRGFVDVSLTQAQKEEAKHMGSDYGRVWTDLIGLVDEGYKLSFTYHAEQTCYTVSLTCNDAGDRNAGLTLSGRGGSVQAACVSLWYRDRVVLEHDWAAAATQGKRALGETDLD